MTADGATTRGQPDDARDHGGGVDAACRIWGGTRAEWMDLSTGINPCPYPVPDFAPGDWAALPDRAAFAALARAARAFWRVPDGAEILPAAGASALIAALPGLHAPGRVEIPGPTYNEHAAAFAAHGWVPGSGDSAAFVAVHPNNPDGRWWRAEALPETAALRVIDESFCDIAPERSLIDHASTAGTVVLKSFGKFWGLAGLRLGFAIGAPRTLAPLSDRIGPWAVSGPALRVGTLALNDVAWAEMTRARLSRDAARLDRLAQGAGWRIAGGTSLFRLYETTGATAAQERLAKHRIWSRVFPYSPTWLRLGLPGRPEDWNRLEAALAP